MAENVQTVQVEYRDNKKIVTHPNGVISEYPKAVLESFKQQMLKQKQTFDAQIAAIDSDLAGIEAAKVPVVPSEPVAPAVPAEPAASGESVQGSENAG